MPNLQYCKHTVEEGYTNPGRQVVLETKFCKVMLNNFGSPVG
jgi:hypothetical protein